MNLLLLVAVAEAAGSSPGEAGGDPRGVATIEETVGAPATDVDLWERRYARRVYLARTGAMVGVAGGVASLGGLVLAVGGYAIGSGFAWEVGITMWIGGTVAYYGCPPLVAAGSVGAARAVRELGGTGVPGFGYATWALWGAGFAGTLAQRTGVWESSSNLPGLLVFGAYTTGLAQLAVDDATWRDMRIRKGLARAGISDAGFLVVPTADGDGLLVLSGRF